jgi:hypothetical protein
MNPAVAGLTTGVAMSLLGLWVIWPALGRGLLPLLSRVTGVFLGKLVLVVTLVLLVHARAPQEAIPFAVSLAVTVVVLLLAQAGLLARKLKQLDDSGTCDPPGRGEEQGEK